MKIVILSIVLLGLWAISLAEDATQCLWDPHQGSDGLIINGEKAEPGEIPYQVLLNTDYLGNPEICGGSLIRPNWVLTTANCIQGKETLVLMGSTNRDNMTYKAYATLRIVHEDFIPNPYLISENDVALLRLPCGAKGPGIAVAELAPENMDSLVAKIVRVSGFGSTRAGHGIQSPSPDLLKANVKVIRNKKCQNKFLYELPESIKSTNLCTVGSTRPTVESACTGDTGGPLVYNAGGKDVIVGLVSFCIARECNRYPAVFTRISSYRKWIDATIAKYA